jgi:hypothetical protein
MRKKNGFIPAGFQFDDDDRAYLESMGCWHRHSAGYLVRFIGSKNGKKVKVYAHRVIMERINNGTQIPAGLVVDHVNSDKSDNRRKNLRLVTIQQNAFNIPKVKGWTKLPCGRYRATIRLSRKVYDLGTWATPEEARAAYMTAKRFLHKI